MHALFDDFPIVDGFSKFGTEIIVLPISLSEYRRLWYDIDGPGFAADLYRDKNKLNKILDSTDWLLPPDDINTIFYGYECRAQRDQSWTLYGG